MIKNFFSYRRKDGVAEYSSFDHLLQMVLTLLFLCSLAMSACFLWFWGDSAFAKSLFSVGIFLFLFYLFSRGLWRITALLTSAYILSLALCSIVDGHGIHDVANILLPLFMLVSSLILPRTIYIVLNIITIVTVGVVGVFRVMTQVGFVQEDLIDVIAMLIMLISIAVITRIITEALSRAFCQIETSEKNYHTIFNAMHESILLSDLTTNKIIDANETASSMFAYHPDDLLGCNLADLFISDNQHSTSATVVSTQEVISSRLRGVKKDGTKFWVEQTTRIITTVSGEKVLSVIRDIDEEKRMNEKLKELEKMKVVGQLSEGIAHDFNNQLAGIIGIADFLKNDFKDSAEAVYCLGMILQAGQRAHNLTTQLLSFSGGGRRFFDFVDVNALTESVLVRLENLTPKSVSVVTDYSANALVVMGDFTFLQNALFNIALNALESMGDNDGSLELQCRGIFLTHDTPSDSCGEFPLLGWCAEIRIRDTGIGIPLENQQKIFEPFFTTKKASKSSGMGLSAAYGIIMQHHGIIRFDSKEDSGTTFKIYLSLTTDYTPQKKFTAPKHVFKNGSSTAHIMVVDDEAVLRLTLSTIFSRAGYEVDVFDNGDSGISFLREHRDKIDLVILDMIMPGKDGLETMVEMRKDVMGIPVIIVSAYSDGSMVQDALAMGNCRFITKPFNGKELIRSVEALLSESSLPSGKF